MLWRPSCPPFRKHVTDLSEINFNMINRFLELENLCVATKSMCLAHIRKKILRISSFGGHLKRHHEYFNFPNDAKVASFSFNVRTYFCKNILCGLFFWVAPKIFIWQPDYNIYLYLFLYIYITCTTINNDTAHLKSPKHQNRRAALGRPAIKLLGALTSLWSTNTRLALKALNKPHSPGRQASRLCHTICRTQQQLFTSIIDSK